jgi:hypothetical protein
MGVKTMVGSWAREPQTATVSKASYQYAWHGSSRRRFLSAWKANHLKAVSTVRTYSLSAAGYGSIINLDHF